MGLTKGNLLSKIQENHQFFIEEGFLKPYFESFTLRSFSQLYKPFYSELKDVGLSGLPELTTNDGQTTIMDLVDDIPICKYSPFQEATQQFSTPPTEISWTDLKEIVSYHENKQFNSSYATNEVFDNIIKDINNSLEKAAIITFNLLGDTIKIRLHFYTRDKRSNERKIAIKQNLMLASVPRFPTGETYSAKTFQHTRSSVDNVGAIIPAKENSTNPQDLIAAPLQVSYDESTGTFKSGNPQILARMLEDLDPAPLEKLIDDNFNVTDIFGNNANLATSLSQFTTAKALPLTIKAGNPNTLSFNYTECSTQKEVSITVVNRSRKSFKKDEVVMLTEINGEWIPMSFGEDIELGGSTRFGDWSFIKMTANSDTYFMDARFLIDPSSFARIITAPKYESDSRIKFYKTVKPFWLKNFVGPDKIYTVEEIEKIYTMNIGQINVDVDLDTLMQPSKKYLFHTIYDQIGKAGGGNLEQDSTFLRKTNLTDPEISQDQGLYANEIPFFWGPVFIDGTDTLTSNDNLLKHLADIWKVKYNSGSLDIIKAFFSNITEDNIKSDDDTLLFSTSTEDNLPTIPTGIHTPAEAVSKIINPLYIVDNYESLGTPRFISERSIIIETPFYGTKINSINKIQFSPLTADFAGSDDLLAKSVYLRPSYGARNFYDYNRGLLPLVNFPYDDVGFKFFRPVYERADLYTIGLFSYQPYQYGEFKCNGIFDETLLEDIKRILTGKDREKTLLYDCYIQNDPINRVLGTPRIFRDTSGQAMGANLVGVIAAKNTITKRAGGTISFSLSQDYGLNKQRTSTSSTDTFGIILGVIINYATGGGLTQGIPQWGSTADNYYDFGTTGLHVRIFDHWPESQTVHDPRYFAVLHFNEGNLTKADNVPPANDSSLDFKVPSEYKNGDLVPIKVDTVITSESKLAIEQLWYNNPIRRGVLLTGSGFTYLKHVIGLHQWQIISNGSNISSKNLNIGKGAQITTIVDDNGQLSDIKFVTDKDTDNVLRGEGFLPSDFAKKITFNDKQYTGYLVTIQSDGGDNAAIIFTNGIVYTQKLTDLAPVEQVPITMLSSGSKRGENFIREGKNTDLSVDRNSSGKYDCFFHFHNDIGHTPAKEDAFVAGFAQYINMTIT